MFGRKKTKGTYRRRKNRVFVRSKQTVRPERQNRKRAFGIRSHTEHIDTGYSTKKKVEIAIGITALVGAAGLLLFHSFFTIKSIQITGIERIDEQELRQAVDGIMSTPTLFLIPGNNYFLLDIHEMRDILQERFPIEHIKVEKRFPKTLSFELQERISTIIYDNGMQYSFAALNGHIVEPIRQVGEDEWVREIKLTTSTNEFGEEIQKEEIISESHTPQVRTLRQDIGDYPIVYDARGRAADINAPVLDASYVEIIIEWYHFLNNQTDIPLSYFLIEEGRGDITIVTHEGWRLHTRPEAMALQRQFHSLMELFEGGEIERNQVSYIDIRYPDRVFWQ